MTTDWSPERLSGNKQIVEHALGEVRTFIDELKNGTRKYRTIASLGGPNRGGVPRSVRSRTVAKRT